MPAPRLPGAAALRRSQWFECLCHGSKYTVLGEKRDGPAPRGMDRFPVRVADGAYVINTARGHLGAAAGHGHLRRPHGDRDAALHGLTDATEDHRRRRHHALAAFTMLYWFTDTMRREAIAAEHEEELAEFGEVIFSNDPTEPAAAGCARCHGADGTGGEPRRPDGRRARTSTPRASPTSSRSTPTTSASPSATAASSSRAT